MEKLTFTPSAAIAGKFEVVNTIHPILYSKIGRLDLRSISLEQAEELHKQGTRYLKAVKAPKNKAQDPEQ